MIVVEGESLFDLAAGVMFADGSVIGVTGKA